MIKKKYQKIAFIYNPHSNKGNGEFVFEKQIKCIINDVLNDREIIIGKTVKRGHGTELAKKYISDKCDLIVACGGDGTINEIVNGIMNNKHNVVALCAIPLGTGNDFCRSINFMDKSGEVNYKKIIEAIKTGSTINIDIGEVKNQENCRYWINSCGVGISGEIVNAINSSKSSWIPKDWVFKLQTVYQNLMYTNKEMKYVINQKDVIYNKSQVIIISNGKYFGGGMMGSPDAILNDGKLNYGILGDIGIIDMFNILPLIYSGNHTKHPKIKTGICTNIECIPVKKSDVVRIETDGELFGYAPCSVSIIENILPLIIFNS